MRLPLSAFCALLLLGGNSCTDAPESRASAICLPKTAAEPPQDTAAFYFPAADSLPRHYVPPAQRLPGQAYPWEQIDNCSLNLLWDSRCLFFFRAPVLAGTYAGSDTYRLLWNRSFHRPVLLTLQRTDCGPMLRTQLLSRQPFIIDPSLLELPSLAPAQLAPLAADPVWPLYLRRRQQSVAVVVDTTVAVSAGQWARFELLLDRARFWQLPACQPEGIVDGAHWRLEADLPGRYHQIDRHSPKPTDAYRRSCEYLLDLSPVLRYEERY
jgi:hypothetical protein